MNFGIINQYFLFGGGSLLCQTAKVIQSLNHKLYVVTSQRHAEENIVHNSNPITFRLFLEQNDIDYCITDDVSNDNNVVDRITSESIGISFGAAWIFSASFIKKFSGKLLNCHGTRLPADRGGGGYSWRIMRNERLGISLIHQIDVGVDTGTIVLFKEYLFPNSCRTPQDYANWSIKQYQELLDHFFTKIAEQSSFSLVDQQEYFSSYWPRLSCDIHGFIDWNWTLTQIERFICAFDDPYNGASTFVRDNKVRLKKCHTSQADGLFHPFQIGIIYRLSENAVFIATENGALVVENVLNEQGADIKHQLKPGDRFFTPIEHLQNAKQTRVIYTPKGLKNK